VHLHAVVRLAVHAAERPAVHAVLEAVPQERLVLPQAVAWEVLDEHLPGARQESKGLQEARFLSVLRSAEPVAAE